MKFKTKIYRGIELKQNPLTGDWLVDFGEPYGAYSGTLQGIKGIVSRYWKHKSESK